MAARVLSVTADRQIGGPPYSKAKAPRRAGPLLVAFLAASVGACGGPAADAAAAPPGEAERKPDESVSAILSASRCSDRNPKATGLEVEYFTQAHFAGQPMAVRMQKSPGLEAGLEQAGPNGPSVRSVRWRGWLKAPVSGTYRFHAQPPGMRVTVSGLPVVGGTVGDGVAVELMTGRYHPILVELDQIAPGPLSVRLEWTAPHGARFAVPATLMFPPSDTVAVPTPKLGA